MAFCFKAYVAISALTMWSCAPKEVEVEKNMAESSIGRECFEKAIVKILSNDSLEFNISVTVSGGARRGPEYYEVITKEDDRYARLLSAVIENSPNFLQERISVKNSRYTCPS